jgi:hypothetical protein
MTPTSGATHARARLNRKQAAISRRMVIGEALARMSEQR